MLAAQCRPLVSGQEALGRACRLDRLQAALPARDRHSRRCALSPCRQPLDHADAGHEVLVRATAIKTTK